MFSKIVNPQAESLILIRFQEWWKLAAHDSLVAISTWDRLRYSNK